MLICIDNKNVEALLAILQQHVDDAIAAGEYLVANSNGVRVAVGDPEGDSARWAKGLIAYIELEKERAPFKLWLREQESKPT